MIIEQHEIDSIITVIESLTNLTYCSYPAEDIVQEAREEAQQAIGLLCAIRRQSENELL